MKLGNGILGVFVRLKSYYGMSVSVTLGVDTAFEYTTVVGTQVLESIFDLASRVVFGFRFRRENDTPNPNTF